MRRIQCGVLAALLLPAAAAAQAPAPAQPPQTPVWAQMPRMTLERQFAGPLQDTIIQRWRDPVDNTVCYVYLPITAAHSTPTQSGYVQYGANTIGTISCAAGTAGGSNAQQKGARAAPPPVQIAPAQPAAPPPAR